MAINVSTKARAFAMLSVHVVDPVFSALAEAGRPLTNDELAERMGVVKGTAHKRVDALIDAGLVLRKRDGRTVGISVA